MRDQQTTGDLTPSTREELDRIHLQARLWTARSRSAEAYERALQEFEIAIPHAPQPTFFDRYRQASVTAIFFIAAFFLYGWGVL